MALYLKNRANFAIITFWSLFFFCFRRKAKDHVVDFMKLQECFSDKRVHFGAADRRTGPTVDIDVKQNISGIVHQSKLGLNSMDRPAVEGIVLAAASLFLMISLVSGTMMMDWVKGIDMAGLRPLEVCTNRLSHLHTIEIFGARSWRWLFFDF